MLIRSKFLFLILFIFCLHYGSTAQDIHFSTVKPPEEAGNSSILGITQDRQGFLWLATENGLYKYDGFQYTAYLSKTLNPNSLESNYIECITAVKDGSIWIGHYGNGKGAERLDPTTGIFTHYHHSSNDPSSIASDSVAAIIQDHEGTIWMGTKQGLDRFDSKTNTFTHYKHNQDDSSSLSYNGVRAVYEDKEGTIWVGTGNAFYEETPGNEGGLNKLDRQTGKFTRYLHKENDPHSLMDNRVRALFEDSHGNFWVGTAGDGLHIMNRKNGTFERYLFDPAHPDKLSRPPVQTTFNYAIDNISFITEDNKGRIWIGTFEGGINVWDPAAQKITYYGNNKKSKELLQDEFFWTAYKTKEGVIWISTWNSGNLYKANPYETQVPYTYIGDTVYAFTEDNTNLLWLATNKGLVSKDSTGKTQRILLDKNLFSYKNNIYNITKDNANQLWLGTLNGLYSFDPVTHHFKTYHHENGNANSLPSDTVSTIKNTDGGLWVSTNNGLGWLDTKTGMFKNYLHDPNDSNSISRNYPTGIVTESNGDLWVGTSNGLNRFDKQTGHFKKYLKGYIISCVMKDGEGNVWAAANGQNIKRYNEQKDIFLDYTDATGLIKQGTIVWDIVEDNQKNLWLLTSKGIIELNVKTNEATLYGKNQGVDTRKIFGWGYARKNGEVLFGDTSGYFSFNDQQLKNNIPPPVVNITNFSLADAMSGAAEGSFSTLINQQKTIRLRHDQNVFSFQFSSVDFISAHEDTRLLYMLENYDNNWRTGSNEQTVYYFNVPPGQYVFKVKAANGYGIWSEKDITIIINPPWWSTWWAYCIYAVCFLSIAFFANRIIRNRIIEKERRKNKEKELAQAKEIEKAYTELKSTQAQLIQSEKMASLGELTAGIAHEIQNPLNFVNNFSEVNKELLAELNEEIEKGNYDDAKSIAKDVIENEEKINHHGKRAGDIVKGMLQHSRSGNGVKEPTDINALADEYLRLAYHGSRAKDKLFNAVMQTDYDESLSAGEAGIGNINIVPQDIGRVILNLITNAFYVVDEKKKQIGEGYEPTVSISTKKVDNKVFISVKDNGNGIPQKVVEKIFQPFFTTKPTGQGTGLGLSLSYDIIKAHGGEIKVETKEGEGSEFVIQLPVI